MKSSVDNDFIRETIRRYTDMVFRIALQNLRHPPDAEDATQTVFLRLFEQVIARGGFPCFDSEEHVKAWLIRVCVNQCKNQKHSAWRRKTAPLDETIPAQTEEHADILAELARLPANDRTVLYLHYFEGYSAIEIADILSSKVNTVYSQLARARKKLKVLLAEGDEEPCVANICEK